MIALIRIKGQLNINSDVKETLTRLRLRKKYVCVVINKPTKVQEGMIKKVRDFVAFGDINKETLAELLFSRAKPDPEQKEKAKKIMEKLGKDKIAVAEEMLKGKTMKDLGFKQFFRLHPPRKGIESKKHFGVGKGVLGNNKEKINDLIMRML